MRGSKVSWMLDEGVHTPTDSDNGVCVNYMTNIHVHGWSKIQCGKQLIVVHP